MEQYNRNDAEAVSIRKKIAQLQTMNEDIVINDVISIEDVRRFEEQQNIKLPQDYVWFITNVGNGGTWDDGERPFYPLADTYFSSSASCCCDKPFSLRISFRWFRKISCSFMITPRF